MTTEEFQKQIADNPFAAINDLVYKYLYDNIVTMEIVPGSSLNESSIAKELQISRTPIRSAIELLERDGLAKREKGRPAIVRPLDAAEYHYISELRYAIEGQAAACAARYITPEELRQLKAIVDDMSRSGDSRVPYPINDTSFHDIIVNASRNPFLIKGYRLYRAKILRHRWHLHLNLMKDSNRTLACVSVHYAIYSALKNHSSYLAEREAWEDAMLMSRTVFSI